MAVAGLRVPISVWEIVFFMVLGIGTGVKVAMENRKGKIPMAPLFQSSGPLGFFAGGCFVAGRKKKRNPPINQPGEKKTMGWGRGTKFRE